MMHKKNKILKGMSETYFSLLLFYRKGRGRQLMLLTAFLYSMGVSQPMAGASRVEEVKARLCQHGVSGTIRSIVRFYIKYNNSRC